MNNKIICALLVGALIITMLYLCKKGESTLQNITTSKQHIHPKQLTPHQQELLEQNKPLRVSGEASRVIEPKNTNPTLVFFRVKGCPHCDNMMGAWANASHILTEGGLTVHDIEMSEQPEIFKKAQSTLAEFGGVPDLRFFPHGFNFGDPQKVVKYSGNRSEESIVGFAYGNLPQEPS
jgi:hypothetical protein